MLTFIDESGYPRPTDSTKNPILLGVCIHENDIKPITNQIYKLKDSKLATTSSTGGLILPLQRGIVTARPEGRCRKHYYWSAYKAVLRESSFLDSSACSFIYFCTASSVILPIVST